MKMMVRNKEMQRMYDQDELTLQEIGDKFGVTRERVRQLINTRPAKRRRMAKNALERDPVYRLKRREARAVERFLAKIDRTTDNGGCWEYTGCKYPTGYGHINTTILDRAYNHRGYAHRLSYAIVNGRIPYGACVLHHCDNPSCVKPDHLYLGTQKQNMEDRERKGRGGWRKPRLTEEEVNTIQMQARNGIPKEEIAKMWDRCWMCIHRVVTGKSYSRVGP